MSPSKFVDGYRSSESQKEHSADRDPERGITNANESIGEVSGRPRRRPNALIRRGIYRLRLA